MVPRIMRKAVMKARLWVNGMRLRRIYAKGEAYAPNQKESGRIARTSAGILRKYSDLLEPADRESLEAVRNNYSKKKQQ